MALDISLAQFNAIASGEYNAGQIDLATDSDGTVSLVKINNHVWRTSQNKDHLSPARILEIKEAFIGALTRGGVSPESIALIRQRLGIPVDIAVTNDKEAMRSILTRRYTPLSRAEVRSILDTYARSGRGFTLESQAAVSLEAAEAAMRSARASARVVNKRNKVNAGGPLDRVDGMDFTFTDSISLLSTTRPLADLAAARSGRRTGANAVNERQVDAGELNDSFKALFGAALEMLQGNIRESGAFTLFGMAAKLEKGEDGKLSAILGRDPAATQVTLDMDADTFIALLIGRAVNDMSTLGPTVVKSVLGMVYDRDIEGGLVASERTSLTRNFAALILERKADDAINLVSGNYNTGLLVEIAERALDGEEVVDTKAKIDAFHARLVQDNAGLPPEMKAMLEQVANIPLERPNNANHEFLVRRPIVGGMDGIVAAIPDPPVEAPPHDATAGDVKDFVADLVFSDDTMVSDVVVNRPGETMRNILSSGKRLLALAEIIKNPNVLDTAAAPQIADVLKDGFARMKAILDVAFVAANNGESLDAAAQKPDFVQRFSLFLKNQQQLPGAELAKFDNIIQSMATRGCEKLQAFVNQVFAVNVAAGQGPLTTEPYKNMSPAQIKAELAGKTLNEILDSAATSDVPGQVGFFKQVISSYYTQLSKADKRSAFAASIRFADVFDFTGKQDDELDSAKKAAVNKFTGAILKGSSPLLQKMMQGLPKEIMGDFADALEDMKSNLAPIPRKIVQAHLMKMIDESNGKILSIEVEKSLGAASVGEAFLCTFRVMENGTALDKHFVVKIMRHDAEKRVKAEAEIFTAAAAKIPGMAKTWEGQLKQYMTEFDFTNEAANVNAGVQLYNIKGDANHPLKVIAPDVSSMKVSTLVPPQKDVMVVEVASGDTVDRFFKTKIAEIRTAASAVFAQDPSTGRILWQDGPVDPATGKPTKVPVFKDNIAATSVSNLQQWLSSHYSSLERASTHLLQATKVWFYQAILGNGQFHGDTHAGNLMVTDHDITFIDFGNLYKLDSARDDGVNEKTELLRVILGAAFRNKDFFLQGMEQLLSASGKAALAANREKAEAILSAVLDKSKGSFSFNIVYRLQAAVVELQKLGLELPPPINCFIQSLVRLSNSVTEINTIMNQCKAMIDATNDMILQPPARDDLDLLGQVFDVFASKDGKRMVPESDAPKAKLIPAYRKFLSGEKFGGKFKSGAATFHPGGEYFNQVAARIGNAADPVAEAGRLVNIVSGHGDRVHNVQAEGILDQLDTGFAKFQTDFAAAQTPEAKKAAVDAFAAVYAHCEGDMLLTMDMGFYIMSTITILPPKTFASTITSVLFSNFDALSYKLAQDEQMALGLAARSIATGELGLGLLDSFSENKILRAIINDGNKMGDDKSYKIDIGV